jgi:hypothetical protein
MNFFLLLSMNLSRLREAVPCLKVGLGGYGHVNFTARAKQKGDTTLTCFCCLKGKKDQVG